MNFDELDQILKTKKINENVTVNMDLFKSWNEASILRDEVKIPKESDSCTSDLTNILEKIVQDLIYENEVLKSENRVTTDREATFSNRVEYLEAENKKLRDKTSKFNRYVKGMERCFQIEVRTKILDFFDNLELHLPAICQSTRKVHASLVVKKHLIKLVWLYCLQNLDIII